MKVQDLINKLLKLDMDATIGISYFVDLNTINNETVVVRGDDRVDIYENKESKVTMGDVDLDYYLR